MTKKREHTEQLLEPDRLSFAHNIMSSRAYKVFRVFVEDELGYVSSLSDIDYYFLVKFFGYVLFPDNDLSLTAALSWHTTHFDSKGRLKRSHREKEVHAATKRVMKGVDLNLMFDNQYEVYKNFLLVYLTDENFYKYRKQFSSKSVNHNDSDYIGKINQIIDITLPYILRQ